MKSLSINWLEFEEMRCHQCDNPALYSYGENISLCLECSHKIQQIQRAQFLQNAAMLNQVNAEMDAHFHGLGVPTSTNHIPVAELARVFNGNTVLNNIRIDNSNVGVLNTGDLARIDAVITLTKDTDAEDIGCRLSDLAQAIIDDRELHDNSKKELIDLVESLSEQIVGAQGQRKPAVIFSLLKSIEERAHGIAAMFSVVEGLSIAIKRFFGP